MKAKFEKINLRSNSSIQVSKFDREAKCGHLYWHLDSEFEIVYIRNGSGRIKIDHSENLYKEGALICIAPNIPHMGFGNEFRIRKACAMLEKRDKNISEVMYLSGFNDLSYFSKQFKNFNGITPSVYQKSFR